MRSKLLIGLAAVLFLASSASAATNTSELYNKTDFTVSPDQVFTGEAFSAEELANASFEVDIDSNESLEATLTGYNDTEASGNTSFDLSDGSSEYDISNSEFGENTSTYVLELNATGGTVSVLDVGITGTEGNTSISGAAPGAGGILTGMFSSASSFIGGIFSGIAGFFGNIVNGFTGFLGGLIP